MTQNIMKKQKTTKKKKKRAHMTCVNMISVTFVDRKRILKRGENQIFLCFLSQQQTTKKKKKNEWKTYSLCREIHTQSSYCFDGIMKRSINSC